MKEKERKKKNTKKKKNERIREHLKNKIKRRNSIKEVTAVDTPRVSIYFLCPYDGPSTKHTSYARRSEFRGPE